MASHPPIRWSRRLAALAAGCALAGLGAQMFLHLPFSRDMESSKPT